MIAKYLKRQWLSILVATSASLVLGLVSAAVYSLIGPALKILMTPDQNAILPLNDLVGNEMSQIVAWFTDQTQFVAGTLWRELPMLIISLAALRALFSMLSWFLWERTGEVVSKELRSDLMAAFMFVDPKNKNPAKDENFSAVLTNDVRMLREYIVHVYGGLPREALQALFYVATLVLLSPRLFLIFFVAILPTLYFISSLGKKLKKRASKALDDYSILTEWLQQRLLGVETIKHYGTEDLEIAKMQTLSTNLFARLVKAARIKARTSPVMEALATAAMVLILFVSLSEVAAGHASGSVQLSFFSTLAILSQSIAKMGRYLNSAKEGEAALVRIKAAHDEFVGKEQQQVGTPIAGTLNGHALTLDQLSVQYDPAAPLALANFSCRFEKGKIYCLAGPSGAGKSTVFRAILGLVAAHEGTIAIAGRGAANSVGYLPQAIQLLPGSIAENVAYPHVEFDSGAVEAALTEVGLWNFVRELPGGLRTTVGTDGQALSGGQAQRLLLARIFYHAFPVVLIDEATSALDPESERVIHEALRRLAARGVTVIMIAHRLSSLERADEVLVVEKGALLFQGSAAAAMQLPLFALSQTSPNLT